MLTSIIGANIMEKEKMKQKLYGRMDVLSDILDNGIQALCEAKANLEIIHYFIYLLEKENEN